MKLPAPTQGVQRPVRSATVRNWLLVLLVPCWLLAACGSTESQVQITSINLQESRAAETDIWRSTVLIENGTGHGTGIIVGDSLILTAYHVVDEGRLAIEFFGTEREEGNLIWFDPALDLAMLRVKVPEQYVAAPLFCGPLQPNQSLSAVGHPLLERWVAVEGHLEGRLSLEGSALLPLDFELSLGNSGGPVFDQSGRVVGIATAIMVQVPAQPIPISMNRAHASRQTGTGLMLPASHFCGLIAQNS